MYSETRSERQCNVTLWPQGALRPRRRLLSGLFVCFSAGGNCYSGRVKKHHRFQLNQLTLNSGYCEHGTGLKTQFSPQPRSQSTAVRSDHCLSAPPRWQQSQTKRFLNVPADLDLRTKPGWTSPSDASLTCFWSCGVGQQSTDGFVRFFFRRAGGWSSSC